MNAQQPTANVRAVVRHAGRAGWARAGRLWRAFATGLCFVLYGAVGWVAGMLLLPILWLWPGTQAARQRRIRHCAAGSFRALLGLITLLRVGRVEIEGREWLAQAPGRLLVANHPMYLDALVLLGQLPMADCVVKQAMLENPFYRRFERAIGYIGNADAVGLLDACVASLKRGRTLLLFPEGTRSTPGQPPRFTRGAAQAAVRSGCEVMPVVIGCEPLGLGKGQSWHQVADRPWVLHLRIFPPQSLASLGAHEGMPHGVAARRVNRALEAFFKRHTQAPAADATPEAPA